MRVGKIISTRALWVCGLVGCLGSVVATAQSHPTAQLPSELGWSEIAVHPDGMRVLRRMNEDGTPMARAVMRTPASVDAVKAVLTDFANHASFVPNLERSDVVAVHAGAHVLHQRLDFPAILSPREYLIRVTADHCEATNTWVMHWAQVPLPKPPSGAVEPRRVMAWWQISADGEGASATYTVDMVPGGQVPPWLVRFGIDDYLPKVMRAVIQRAEAASPDRRPNVPLDRPMAPVAEGMSVKRTGASAVRGPSDDYASSP